MSDTSKRPVDGRHNSQQSPKRETPQNVKMPHTREHGAADLPLTPAPDIGAHALARRAEAPARESKDTVQTLAPHVLEAMIAEAAYYRAERRGFAPGRELEDWLQAEREILRALASRSPWGP